jgi:hypothetical protein
MFMYLQFIFCTSHAVCVCLCLRVYNVLCMCGGASERESSQLTLSFHKREVFIRGRAPSLSFSNPCKTSFSHASAHACNSTLQTHTTSLFIYMASHVINVVYKSVFFCFIFHFSFFSRSCCLSAFKSVLSLSLFLQSDHSLH